TPERKHRSVADRVADLVVVAGRESPLRIEAHDRIGALLQVARADVELDHGGHTRIVAGVHLVATVRSNWRPALANRQLAQPRPEAIGRGGNAPEPARWREPIGEVIWRAIRPQPGVFRGGVGGGNLRKEDERD